MLIQKKNNLSAKPAAVRFVYSFSNLQIFRHGEFIPNHIWSLDKGPFQCMWYLWLMTSKITFHENSAFSLPFPDQFLIFGLNTKTRDDFEKQGPSKFPQGND